MGPRAPSARRDEGGVYMGAVGGKDKGHCTAGAKLCINKAKGGLGPLGGTGQADPQLGACENR